MNNQTKTIQRLSFENWIWVVYIGIAVFSIYGDELIKKSLLEGDKQANERANKIFGAILILTLIIYLYFLARNYSDYKEHPDEEEYAIRLLGSILVFLGTLCFLYFQQKTTEVDDSLSNI